MFKIIWLSMVRYVLYTEFKHVTVSVYKIQYIVFVNYYK